MPPDYKQKSFADAFKPNQFTQLISPDGREESLVVNQDAYFEMGTFDAGQQISYSIKQEGNGAYVFLLEGEVEIANNTLNKRDALGVYDTSSFTIATNTPSHILIMEVSML
ncbi:pirin family protein [Mucilaginibacter robiniae]|uniref:pirin family protein n=1 Tax=Mucilaginibacter robiniae TaxID=2728022 RepID=UPI0036F2E12C